MIDWTIPSSIKKIREKVSEEGPYSNEWSTHRISKVDLGSPLKPEKLIGMQSQWGLLA